MRKTLCILLVLMLAAVVSAQFGMEQNVLAESTVVIHGLAFCTESDAPLYTGMVNVDNMNFPIEQGRFQLELVPGNYSITVTGAYRQPKSFALSVSDEPEHLEITLDPKFSAEEIDLLAKITRAEAEGESPLGQTAVAATVLNRVSSSRYPSTIAGVVYQKESGRYQYSPVADGRINLPPTPQSYEAAFQALSGVDPTHGATGFFNPAKTGDGWVRSHPVTTVIGGHRFFKY